MASATIETFCCITSTTNPSIVSKLQFYSLPYNIVCAISSFLGTIGALYQILPLPDSQVALQRCRNAGHRQRSIINWLAVGDLFASSGIFLRSIFWLTKGSMEKNYTEESDTNIIVCALFAIWIRYFYTTTFLWTLCYAIDVYLVSKQKIGNPKAYHLFTWLLSGVLTIVGLGTLYLPHFKCHSGPERVLPNYLLSYIPIVFVMIINPILYYLSSKQVRVLLTGGLGQLTCQEHSILSALKEKFFCIVIVYYVCWIPNVVNGIILWGFWSNLPQPFLIGVWYAMAVVNPLQAVLNSLVYKGWGNCRTFYSVLFCQCRKTKHSGLVIEPSSTEGNPTTGHDRLPFSTNADEFS